MYCFLHSVIYNTTFCSLRKEFYTFLNIFLQQLCFMRRAIYYKAKHFQKYNTVSKFCLCIWSLSEDSNMISQHWLLHFLINCFRFVFTISVKPSYCPFCTFFSLLYIIYLDLIAHTCVCITKRPVYSFYFNRFYLFFCLSWLFFFACIFLKNTI